MRRGFEQIGPIRVTYEGENPEFLGDSAYILGLTLMQTLNTPRASRAYVYM